MPRLWTALPCVMTALVYVGPDFKSNGYNVRCLKDERVNSGVLLESPRLSSPGNGAATQSITPALFTWNTVPGAASYILQAATDNSFSSTSLVVNENVGNNLSKQVSGLNLLSTYYWRVSAISNSGASDWSDVWSFTTPSNTITPKGWVQVWSDEFNYNGLPDSTKWGYDVGTGLSGWGNNELEYYTFKNLNNARVKDTVLIIEARNEQYNNSSYTSARLVSADKGDWTYGRFEIRAKLPGGTGTWPAIWMLSTDKTYGNGKWPDNGEIDIMEHVGYDPGNVIGAVHCNLYNGMNNRQKNAVTAVPDAETAFHVYALEWNKDSINIFVDDVKYFTMINENTGWQAWPFNKNFHLILNVAVGGNWGGKYGVVPSIFPQQMVIDYVRVFQWVN